MLFSLAPRARILPVPPLSSRLWLLLNVFMLLFPLPAPSPSGFQQPPPNWSLCFCPYTLYSHFSAQEPESACQKMSDHGIPLPKTLQWLPSHSMASKAPMVGTWPTLILSPVTPAHSLSSSYAKLLGGITIGSMLLAILSSPISVPIIPHFLQVFAQTRPHSSLPWPPV